MNNIMCGNSAELLKEFSDNCIDLTITSPPYDYALKVRKYKKETMWDNSIFEQLANNLFRITKYGGVVVWVVNDTTVNGSETGYSFKQALYFKEIGFNLHDTMIYAKNNPVPLTHNRYEQQFEYCFVFVKPQNIINKNLKIVTKGGPKTFNPIMRENKNFGKKRSGGRIRHNGKDLGPKHTPGIIGEKSIDYNIWFFDIGYKKTSIDDVTFNHPAAFPEELAKKHIITWSNQSDLILDPMCGSGTVCVAAKKLNRNYIGIDISEEYCNLAIKRLDNLGKM